jgi:hypothetical protein
MLWSAVVYFLAVGSIVLAARIAERRGRSRKTWFWLGFLFGPVALAAVALLPKTREETTS